MNPVSHPFNPIVIKNHVITSVWQASYNANPIQFFQDAIRTDFASVQVLYDALKNPDNSIPNKFRFLLNLTSPESRKVAYAALNFALGEMAQAEQSNQQAVSYYQLAAELGCLESETKLVEMYINGKELEHNTDHAVELLTRRSKNGNLFDTIQLGKLFAVLGNYHKALEILKPAADHGILDAAYWLGQLYLDHGAEKELAEPYLLMAANGLYVGAIQLIVLRCPELIDKITNPELLYALGILFRDGSNDGVIKQDNKRAIGCLRKAANQKLDKASYALAKLLLESKDNTVGQEVIKLLKQVAFRYDYSDVKDISAVILLGNLHLNGDESVGIPQNEYYAEPCLVAAEKKGDIHSSYLLGQLRLSQCERNYKNYQTYAQLQGYETDCDLSSFVHKVKGPKKPPGVSYTEEQSHQLYLFQNLAYNFEQVITHFKQAKFAKHAQAQYQLAMLYPDNYLYHQIYLESAIKIGGCPKASYQLGLLLLSKHEPNKAITHFYQALEDSNNKDSKSAFELGKIYETFSCHPRYQSQSSKLQKVRYKQLAAYYYELAANLGHEKAKQALVRLRPTIESSTVNVLSATQLETLKKQDEDLFEL